MLIRMNKSLLLSVSMDGGRVVMYAPMDGQSFFIGCSAGIRMHLQRSRLLFYTTRIWDPGFETHSVY
jgi:hypothetical protein